MVTPEEREGLERLVRGWSECRLTAPKVLEPSRRQFCVSDRVLNVLVTQVGLQRPGVVALVGQSVTASVPQHRCSRCHRAVLATPSAIYGWPL
jgi:hypothetical protein